MGSRDFQNQQSFKIPTPQKQIHCQSLTSDKKMTKSGSLRKPMETVAKLFHDFLNVKWSLKYVVLRDGCIYIYKSENSKQYDKATTLYGFCNVLELGPQHRMPSWAFRMVNAIDEAKSILFAASSQDEMNSWLNTLREEIFNANSQMYSDGSKSLLRRGELPKFTDAMKTRYRESMSQSGHSFEFECPESFDEDEDIPFVQSDYTEIDEFIPSERRVMGNHNRPPLPVPVPVPGSSHNVHTQEIRTQIHKRKVPTPPITVEKPPVAAKPKINSAAASSKSPGTDFNRRPSIDQSESKWSDSRDKMKNDCEYEETPMEDDVDCIYDDIHADDALLREASHNGAYWFGDPERARAILMDQYQEGIYLIREGKENDFMTLMVCSYNKNPKCIRKFRITRKDKIITIEASKQFNSFKDLFQYYSQNSLPNGTTKLFRPYSHD